MRGFVELLFMLYVLAAAVSISLGQCGHKKAPHEAGLEKRLAELYCPKKNRPASE